MSKKYKFESKSKSIIRVRQRPWCINHTYKMRWQFISLSTFIYIYICIAIPARAQATSSKKYSFDLHSSSESDRIWSSTARKRWWRQKGSNDMKRFWHGKAKRKLEWCLEERIYRCLSCWVNKIEFVVTYSYSYAWYRCDTILKVGFKLLHLCIQKYHKTELQINDTNVKITLKVRKWAYKETSWGSRDSKFCPSFVADIQSCYSLEYKTRLLLRCTSL